MMDVNRQNRRKEWILLIATALLPIAFLVSLKCGSLSLSLERIADVIWSHVIGAQPAVPLDNVIVWNIRLPRLFLAALAGIALSVAGTAYQGCFKNPLVEPYLLGVSSGASLGAALAIVFPFVFFNVQVSSFVFASLAVFLSVSISRTGGRMPPVTLVLAGVLIGSVFSACVAIMKYISEDSQLREITFWMMGSFHYATWQDVLLNAAFIFPASFIIWLFSWKLNVLSLGDEEAKSLGIHPDRTRLICLSLATLIASICVSTVGVIAWVGLMMPHAARFVIGSDNRSVIPLSAVFGALYMILCDTLARTLSAAEIPVAIIVSIIGAPFLLWLLKTKGKELQHG